ncbi:MAG: hypothetical protein HQL46_14340 [Gammaproteobacteria bacterium]|nr:hypothetical protein [Gammaproteobacteria bacterium]
MDPKALNEKREDFKSDPLLKRIWTYTARIHNKNANTKKNKVYLEKSIAKLSQDTNKFNEVVRYFQNYELEIKRKANLIEQILDLQGFKSEELEEILEKLKAEPDSSMDKKLINEVKEISKKKYDTEFEPS